MSPNEFEASLDRIHRTIGTKTQVQLAALLDIRQSSISDAKRRGSVPDGWLVKLLEEFGLNPSWIKTGQGAAYLVEDATKETPAGLRAPESPAAPEPSVDELKASIEAMMPGMTVHVLPQGAEVTVRIFAGHTAMAGDATRGAVPQQ